jgi:low affinity Fe/Cu permease
MNEHHSYLSDATRKIAKKCEEPSAVIAAMVLLFVLLIAAPVASFLLATIVFMNAAIAAIILVLVLVLHNAHRHDIRMLQARLAALVASNEDRETPAETATLTQSELLQIRELLASQPGEHDASNRRTNRDNRPSLF